MGQVYDFKGKENASCNRIQFQSLESKQPPGGSSAYPLTSLQDLKICAQNAGHLSHKTSKLEFTEIIRNLCIYFMVDMMSSNVSPFQSTLNQSNLSTFRKLPFLGNIRHNQPYTITVITQPDVKKTLSTCRLAHDAKSRPLEDQGLEAGGP